MLTSLRRWSHRRTGIAALVLGSTALAGVTAAGVPAQAEVLYVPWSTYLPGWTDEYLPTSANDCVAGRKTCVIQTSKELNRVLQDTGRGCSHHAVFALAYTRMTQTYAWSRDEPGFYDDVPFANHQDAVFAKYYTDAWTSWRKGDRAAVPQAWRIAFDAAAAGTMTGTGDLLLGMNAHINRDLPFVLAAVGLVAPDGSSRKKDFDKVEKMLAAASEPLIAEAAQRFDPRMDDTADPLDLGYTGVMQLISAWRENAWRNAESLVAAPNAEARALVAAGIESEATAAARTLSLTHRDLTLLPSSPSRGSWCAAHNDDPAPLSYPFGTAHPYRT